MDKQFKNYCFRCGKERVISKVWKEKVGSSIVETIKRVCPDKDCQEKLDIDLAKIRRKRLETEKRRKELIKFRKN